MLQPKQTPRRPRPPGMLSPRCEEKVFIPVTLVLRIGLGQSTAEGRLRQGASTGPSGPPSGLCSGRVCPSPLAQIDPGKEFLAWDKADCVPFLFKGPQRSPIAHKNLCAVSRALHGLVPLAAQAAASPFPLPLQSSPLQVHPSQRARLP